MEHGQPLVTVIIPLYNGARTIVETLRSACAQTVRELEILVIDDGSSDGGPALVEDFSRDDARVRLLRNEKNLGVGRTRNRGMREARGEYLAFLDSDDLWKPQKLQRQLALLEETGADLCFAAYAFIDEAGKETGREYRVPQSVDYDGLLGENVIGCSTVVLRRSRTQGFWMDPHYFHEDYVFWLELLKSGRRAVGINEVLVLYRTGGRSGNKLRAAKNRWIVYRKSQRLGFWRSCGCFWRYVKGTRKKYF